MWKNARHLFFSGARTISSKHFISKAVLLIFIFALCFWVGVKQSDFVAERTTNWNKETQLLQFLEKDLQYFPFVAALSTGKLSEFQTKDDAGSTLIGIPFFSVAPIAILVAAFGENGWIYSRGLIYSFYFFSFFALVYVLTGQFILSLAIGLFYFIGCFNSFNFPLVLEAKLDLLVPEHLNYSIDTRIPRPLVADLYAWLLIGAVVLLVKNTLRNENTLGAWLGVLVLLCLLMQAEIYLAFTFVITFCVLIAVRVLAIKLRQLPVLAAAGILLISPFMVQLITSSADLHARLGVEIVPRSVFLSSIASGHYFRLFLASLVFLSVLKLLEHWNWITRFDFRVLLLLTATVTISQCGMDLFGLITGKMIQGYHFGIAARFFINVFILISGTIFLMRVSRAPVKIEVFAVILLILSFADYYRALQSGRLTQKNIITGHLRSDFETYSGLGAHYQDDFSKLTDFLNGRIGDGLARGLILSTFDHQVASWWMTFKRQYLFLPDVFISTLPQSMIEGRFGYNCYLIGLSPDECVGLLTTADDYPSAFGMNNAISDLFFGHTLYHTNVNYSLSPKDSYSAEQIARTRRTPGYESWHLEISQLEQARLSAIFAKATGGYQSPDYFVFFNTGRLGWLAGRFEESNSEKNYCKVFENATFIVFEKNANLSEGQSETPGHPREFVGKRNGGDLGGPPRQ